MSVSIALWQRKMTMRNQYRMGEKGERSVWQIVEPPQRVQIVQHQKYFAMDAIAMPPKASQAVLLASVRIHAVNASKKTQVLVAPV